MGATMFPQGVDVKLQLPDEIKSAIAHAITVFVVAFVPAALNFLSVAYSWAQKGGKDPLPDISTLGYALVAALLSAATFVIVAAYRYAQGKFSWIPGLPPKYLTK